MSEKYVKYLLENTFPKLTIFIEDIGHGLYKHRFIVDGWGPPDEMERTLTKREVDDLMARMRNNGWVRADEDHQ